MARISMSGKASAVSRDGMQIFPPRIQVAIAAEIRRQERFGVNDSVLGRLLQHGLRKLCEVFRALQNGARSFIDTQEITKITIRVIAIAIEDRG